MTETVDTLYRLEPTSRLMAMLIDDYRLRSHLYSHGHGPMKHEPAAEYTVRLEGLRKLLEAEIDRRIPADGPWAP